MSRYAELVVGFPLSEVLKREKYKTKVTKYNEDTGKPYEKEVDKVRYLFMGEEIDTKQFCSNSNGKFYIENFIDSKFKLSLSYPGYYELANGDYCNILVGISVRYTDYIYIEEVNITEIEKKINKIKIALHNQNITNIVPKLYILSADN